MLKSIKYTKLLHMNSLIKGKPANVFNFYRKYSEYHKIMIFLTNYCVYVNIMYTILVPSNTYKGYN